VLFTQRAQILTAGESSENAGESRYLAIVARGGFRYLSSSNSRPDR
jgi:hypothetical protein